MKWRSKANIKPKYFYARLGNEWKAIDKYDMAKPDFIVMNWEELNKACLDSSLYPFPEIRMLLSSEYREGTFAASRGKSENPS
jgi:hypothetical protein